MSVCTDVGGKMAVVKSRYPDVEIPEDITFHELIFAKFDEYGNRKAIVSTQYLNVSINHLNLVFDKY